MASEISNGWRPDVEPTPDRLVAWWVRQREHLVQERLRASRSEHHRHCDAARGQVSAKREYGQ
jgi:hypothetical protein